jgi:hypothetical protein
MVEGQVHNQQAVDVDQPGLLIPNWQTSGLQKVEPTLFITQSAYLINFPTHQYAPKCERVGRRRSDAAGASPML